MEKKRGKRRLGLNPKRFIQYYPYSQKAVVATLDRYIAVAKNPDQKRELKSLKEHFVYTEQQKSQARQLRGFRFLKERKNDVQLQSLRKAWKDRDRLKDQHDRGEMLRYANWYYRRHASLVKNFRMVSSKAQGKSRPQIRTAKFLKQSHKYFIEQLQLYASLAKTQEQRKKMEFIIDTYREKKQTKAYKRMSRNNKIIRFMGSKIEGWTVMRHFEEIDKMLDADDRRLQLKGARNYYHRNYSLSQQFRRAKTPTKTKDVERDKN